MRGAPGAPPHPGPRPTAWVSPPRPGAAAGATRWKAALDDDYFRKQPGALAAPGQPRPRHQPTRPGVDGALRLPVQLEVPGDGLARGGALTSSSLGRALVWA